MALAFKRSRLDMAHRNTYPNAKEEVIARTDVTNKNLLKNPFRTGDIAVGPVGVQNRPPNRMVDDRGAMYGGSVSVLRKDISNTNLLMNPYRFKTDPIDEPRTLTRQVIMDINSGKTPKYIRENKGIDEIAFMIVKALPDNGVKLATLSMLKSYITGMRLQSVLDQGGQNVVKAFDVLNQLVVTCTSLYKTGMLGMKLPGLLLQYSEDIAKVFNESVLQPVSPMLMFSAIQELASVSAVLTKLFRAQNSISTATNVSIDEWARQEAAKMQALRLQEAANTAPPVPVQQVTVAGDNQPTGTQGVKDADSIKQDGTGKKRKKKKLSEMMGGAELNWGIANPSNTQLTPNAQPSPPIKQPSLIQEPTNTVNKMPEKPSTSDKVVAGIGKGLEITLQVVGAGLGLYGAYTAWKDAGLIQEQREEEKQKKEEREGYLNVGLGTWDLLSRRKKDFIEPIMNGAKIRTLELQRKGLNIAEITEIMSAKTNLGKINKLIDVFYRKQQEQEWDLPADQGDFIDDDPIVPPGGGPPPPGGGPPPPGGGPPPPGGGPPPPGGGPPPGGVPPIPVITPSNQIGAVEAPPKLRPQLPPKPEKPQPPPVAYSSLDRFTDQFKLQPYIDYLESELERRPNDKELIQAIADANNRSIEMAKEDHRKKNDYSDDEKKMLKLQNIEYLEDVLNSLKNNFFPYKRQFLTKLIEMKQLGLPLDTPLQPKKTKKKKKNPAAAEQEARGKKRRKTQKSKKITIKKSKNLDAQILALLRA